MRARQNFEEKHKGYRLNVNKITERTSEATGAGRTVVSRIQSEENVQKWTFEDNEVANCKMHFQFPDKFSSLV